MPKSAVDVIAPAFERMKRQLFKPFNLGQWVRLAVVGLLAGEMGSSGGCSGRFPLDSSIPSSPDQQFQIPEIVAGMGAIAFVLIAVAIILGLVIGIALLYVSSRMRFVLFDSVIEGQCRIRQFWSRRAVPAFHYFIWQLLLTVASIVSFVVIVGVPFLIALAMGWFTNPSDNIPPLILGGILILGFFFIWTVGFLLIQVLTKDFVIPQMALNDITTAEGWRRLWPMMKADFGGYAGYIGMKLVVSIASAIVFGILTLVVILLLLLPVGGAGILTVLLGRVSGLTWNPVTVALAIVIGFLVVLCLFVISALVSVPVIVFFPAYSIHFFAERYEPLRTLLYPEAPPEIGIPPVQP